MYYKLYIYTYTLYIFFTKYKLNIQNKLHSFVPAKKVFQSYTRILSTVALKKYKNLINSIIKGMCNLCKEIFNGKYKTYEKMT